MKFFHLFLLFSFLFCLGNIQAENSVDLFFERLKTPQNGVSVRIIQDERIVSKMKNERESKISNAEQRTQTVAGYRVQVFSSNTARTAKSEAFRIETDFKNTVEGVP
ncbi:MAG: hypothetical protein LBR75_03135, partial [Prevotellaceae bacterium]|nr:hypothetical protein [Prevotellaceae bacterium]